MAGKKGMKKYPESIRNEIRQKQESRQSVKSLSKENVNIPLSYPWIFISIFYKKVDSSTTGCIAFNSLMRLQGLS